MRKKIFYVVGISALVIFLLLIFHLKQKETIYHTNGINYVSKVEGRDFFIYSDKKWEKKFLKGVNIGAAKPGYFPGELAITKEEYLRWFTHIQDMNADVIRVYTTLTPDFYNAFYEFNKTSKKPLYLMQGVWINEEDIGKLSDAYAEDNKILRNFIQDAKDLVDIIHGNAILPERSGFASGKYTKDISPYVIGWILGVEWEPDFVINTNRNHSDKTEYSGNYLYTVSASPFEVFLCEAGDQIIEYERTNYHMVRAMSFTNWLTTDILSHPNEPFEKEDLVEVNMEHIHYKDSFPSGLFASYHIYPYYPEFMNFQREYVGYLDSTGKIDTYRAYLRELFNKHSMPILVAEFGVPASRGKAHDSKYSGYNQGKHDETEQGRIISELLKKIYEEGYCGALVFNWQDEWFKRTWNTMDFDLPERRPFWSNPQTNEQEFGLLAFDPGAEKSICYVDGDISEWNLDTPIITTDSLSVYTKYDEEFIYIMVNCDDYIYNRDILYIPIDTIPNQGNKLDRNTHLTFARPVDFLIQIKGYNSSRIMVDAYYDSFSFLYAEQLKMIEKSPYSKIKRSGVFHFMFHCLSREMYLPKDKKAIPFTKYETGELVRGDANPEHENYYSLADFAYNNNSIEIRIPWQLLNVMDPSTKSIMGDLYKNGSIKAEVIDGIYIGAQVVNDEKDAEERVEMGFSSWKGWEKPTYHERLKRSYYILKEEFSAIR